MRKIYFFCFTLILLVAGYPDQALATIFRVNNTLTENIPGKLFNNIQTAHNNSGVLNGDTLMLESSAIPYGRLQCSKRLVLIGPGFFLGQNPGTNGVAKSAYINDNWYFNNGSQGSSVIGLDFEYGIIIIVSNIYIKRCKCSIQFTYNGTTSGTNCVINGSYIESISGYSPNNANNSVTNSIIEYDQSGLTYDNYDNNVLVSASNFTITASTFRSNILVDRDVQVTINAQNKQNNLAQNGQFGNTNGNIIYDPNQLFVGGSSTDGKYQIKSNSPYINAGYNSTQPGLFGGSAPYRLSGYPTVPIIYELNVPGTGSTAQGMTINVKIRNAN